VSLRTPVAPIFDTAPWTPRFWHDLPNRQPHLFLSSHRHLIQQHHAGARTETHKTGVRRNLPLSPETIQALKELPRSGQLVFYTLEGHPWVTTVVRTKSNGEREYTPVNRITPTFSRLMKRLGSVRQREQVSTLFAEPLPLWQRGREIHLQFKDFSAMLI